MKIAPVQSFPPSSEEAENAGLRPGHTASQVAGATEEAQPGLGTLPNQEKSIAKNVPSSYELPQDVVEMHQDPEIKGQIIIQYLDPAKNVVLQVPSSEELDFERAIAQELQQAAKQAQNPSVPVAGSEGGKEHGD